MSLARAGRPYNTRSVTRSRGLDGATRAPTCGKRADVRYALDAGAIEPSTADAMAIIGRYAILNVIRSDPPALAHPGSPVSTTAS
jgi:hypothetical protein